MRKSGNISQDPSFNTVYLKKLRANGGTNNIEVYSNFEIKRPNTLTVSQLKIIQDSESDNINKDVLKENSSTSFVIDIDEANPNTLVIRKFENDFVVDTGVLYDTQFNKPDGGPVLYISPTFQLPLHYEEAYSYLVENPSKLLVLELTEETQFSLPTFKQTGEDDFRQIRISNTSFFPLKIFHNATQIVEMFHERISIVWCQKGGIYSWIYVP